VVFPTEHELKRHVANEHGDELKMSRAQRREAMSIPVNLHYRSGAGEGGVCASCVCVCVCVCKCASVTNLWVGEW